MNFQWTCKCGTRNWLHREDCIHCLGVRPVEQPTKPQRHGVSLQKSGKAEDPKPKSGDYSY